MREVSDKKCPRLNMVPDVYACRAFNLASTLFIKRSRALRALSSLGKNVVLCVSTSLSMSSALICRALSILENSLFGDTVINLSAADAMPRGLAPIVNDLAVIPIILPVLLRRSTPRILGGCANIAEPLTIKKAYSTGDPTCHIGWPASKYRGPSARDSR